MNPRFKTPSYKISGPMAERTEGDIHNLNGRLERTVRRIERSTEISKRNKKTLQDFYNQCLADGLSPGRIEKYMILVTKISVWLGKNFEDADKEDIKRIVMGIEQGDYEEWTKHDYKVALKKFYKWLRKSEDYPEEVRWLKSTIKHNKEKLPEELLTGEDVDKLIEKADHPRDKAFVSVLWESGADVGEIAPLRLKHVTFEEKFARIIVSGKRGMRRILLVESTPYLASWMAIHPMKDNPEAFLLVGIGTANKNQPVDYPGLRKLLQELARKAEIGKRVNTKTFRHSRATYLANHLTEAQMCEVFGWVQGSEMPSVYVHLSGRDTDKAIMKVYGMKEEEKKEESARKPKECPICQHINSAKERFCGGCGYALDVKTAMELEERVKQRRQKLETLLQDGTTREFLEKRMVDLGLV